MMTTEQGAPAPVVPAVPSAVAPVAATPAPKPQVLASDLPDDALKARLEQAKATGQTELLRSLGVENPEQLKTALAAVKAAEDAKKTDTERLAILSQQVTSLTQAVGVAVEQAASGITPEQRTAIDDIAGTDQALWLRTYKALAPTWKAAPLTTTASAAAPNTQAAPVPTPAALPANTAPAPTAPAPAGTQSEANHKAVYEQLQQRNPIQAARYFQQHQREIYPDK